MPKIVAAITTSVDGYITGPDDGPDKGLGEGGERLHYWVMGGPWTYDNDHGMEPEGVDAAALLAVHRIDFAHGIEVLPRRMDGEERKEIRD